MSRHITSLTVCDCQDRSGPRVRQRSTAARPKWNVYDDFRKMIDKEKLDAVMIETTTHARAWIAIHAMQAGLDVYIEKPMCLTIAEGRAMVNAARKYNRVTQVGTQQRSMPINNWASDLVKNGALGKMLTVLAPNFVGPDRWTKTSTRDVKGPVEPWWDMWTNQAELRPLEDALHDGWARWRDYDGGGLCFGVTGWGAHSYDQINRALGTDDTGPLEVLLEEPVADRDTGRFAPQDRRRRNHRRHRRPGHRHRVSPHGQAHRPAGEDHHEVRQRHGVEAAPRRRPRPGPGGDLQRRKGQDRDQSQQARQQPQRNRGARTTPAPFGGPKRPTTSRIASTASRAASAATPTSKLACGRPRSATWSTSPATLAASAGLWPGTPPPSDSPTARRRTISWSWPRRAGYELPKV